MNHLNNSLGTNVIKHCTWSNGILIDSGGNQLFLSCWSKCSSTHLPGFQWSLCVRLSAGPWFPRKVLAMAQHCTGWEPSAVPQEFVSDRTFCTMQILSPSVKGSCCCQCLKVMWDMASSLEHTLCYWCTEYSKYKNKESTEVFTLTANALAE